MSQISGNTYFEGSIVECARVESIPETVSRMEESGVKYNLLKLKEGSKRGIELVVSEGDHPFCSNQTLITMYRIQGETLGIWRYTWNKKGEIITNKNCGKVIIHPEKKYKEADISLEGAGWEGEFCKAVDSFLAAEKVFGRR